MIEERELLEGQRNIFEVIADFENIPEKPKQKRKRKIDVSNAVPVPIKTEEWLKQKLR